MDSTEAQLDNKQAICCGHFLLPSIQGKKTKQKTENHTPVDLTNIPPEDLQKYMN